MEIKFKKILNDDDIKLANNIISKIIGETPDSLENFTIKENYPTDQYINCLKLKSKKKKVYLLNDTPIFGVAFDEYLNRLYFLVKKDKKKYIEPFACIDWI